MLLPELLVVEFDWFPPQINSFSLARPGLRLNKLSFELFRDEKGVSCICFLEKHAFFNLQSNIKHIQAMAAHVIILSVFCRFKIS